MRSAEFSRQPPFIGFRSEETLRRFEAEIEGATGYVCDVTDSTQCKAAQRSLAQSMARSLGPEGVHVSYLVIDGVIDTPRTRRTDWGRGMPDDFFLCPADVAQEVHTLAHQPKTAWTFEMDIRPFGEKW